MGLVFDNAILNVLAVLFTLVVGFVTFFKWSFTYWERKKMPYLKPTIPWGTLSNLLFNPKPFGEMTMRQYQEAKQNGYKQVVGIYKFSSPECMIIDPLLIKDVISNDFKYFVDRGSYFNEKDDPLSAHLFSIEGTKWRNLRVKLTPTFTSGKMKMMFNVLKECGDQLHVAMNKLCTKNEPIDIKDLLARFTTNIIGSAAFGLECNTFSNEDSEFRKYGKKIFMPSRFKTIQIMIALMNPKLGRLLGICLTPNDVSEFFQQVIKGTVEYREKNNIERNDFMQLLINLKNGVQLHGHEKDNEQQEYKHDGKSLTLEELSAQAYVFFVAGFETSSTTMTFCLYELAINQEIQNKVRREIKQVLDLHDGVLTYDALNDMKYMRQVVDETLRKYPPIPVLNRQCNEDYKLRNTDWVLEKGTSIIIPLTGLQNDPEYFPEPEKFDPERFSDENKHNIHPYTFLPFGEGPRACIGLRFGLMETKVGLTVLLQNFKFSLNSKTKVPIQMEPASFIQSTLGNMWLNVEKI